MIYPPIFIFPITQNQLMRKALTLLLMLASASTFAQSMQVQTKMPAPTIIVDSVLVNNSYLSSISPDEIQSVDVKRVPEFPNGVIYITTKDKAKAMGLLASPLLSLNDIVKKHIKVSKKPIIFIIDGTMLTDTLNVRIPSSTLHGVIIKEAAETAYFKTALPNVLIMMISTKPITINIRGNEF